VCWRRFDPAGKAEGWRVGQAITGAVSAGRLAH
jgi:hypothetical protein